MFIRVVSRFNSLYLDIIDVQQKKSYLTDQHGHRKIYKVIKLQFCIGTRMFTVDKKKNNNKIIIMLNNIL